MSRDQYRALAAIAAWAITPGGPKAAAQNQSISLESPLIAPTATVLAHHLACAADGYYGPEWFNAGVFIGAGSWFHGPNDFQGKVDNTFDPQNGYIDVLPKDGDQPAAQRRTPEKFRGNEVRDGRGNIQGERPQGKT